MHHHMCGICAAALVICCIPMVFIAIIMILLALAGAWTPLMWVGMVGLFLGGMLFLTTYAEARRHWKRGERYE